MDFLRHWFGPPFVTQSNCTIPDARDAFEKARTATPQVCCKLEKGITQRMNDGHYDYDHCEKSSIPDGVINQLKEKGYTIGKSRIAPGSDSCEGGPFIEQRISWDFTKESLQNSEPQDH